MDPETGEVGVAVASCVGFELTVVPILVPGVGAAASQANISPGSGVRFIEALEGGSTASETIEVVVVADDALDDRQFGVVVLGDSGAGWTGASNPDVALDRRSADRTVSVQGNILVSDAAVEAALAAFDATGGTLADRLLAGLVAGANEGGDSQCGEQTARAATLIVARPGDQSYAFTDAGMLGVDPDIEAVPSVFVSVLFEEGAERAPDRLAQVWADVDRSASSVVVRQIDKESDTANQSARTAVLVFLGVVAAIIVVSIWVIVHAEHQRKIA